VKCLFAGLLLPLVMSFQSGSTQHGRDILGTWAGTSMCMDRRTDVSCKDENVVYVFRKLGSSSDSVMLDAFKIIKGERVPMGSLPFVFSLRSGEWMCEFTTRVHGLWTYQVRDSSIIGTLVELPSKRLIRQAAVHRIPR
jgi:hypothetical protein